MSMIDLPATYSRVLGELIDAKKTIVELVKAVDLLADGVESLTSEDRALRNFWADAITAAKALSKKANYIKTKGS